MNESVRLTLLRCTECQSNLAGESEGVFLYCSGCGSGFWLDEEKLQKVPVYFAKSVQKPEAYFPFWAFDTTLEIHDVETRKGILSTFNNRGGLIRAFQEHGSLRFYVSAFQGDLDAPHPRALELTVAQPQLESVDRLKQVDGFVVSLQDARKVADFLFLTSEIEQPDMMRKLQYTLTLNNPIVMVVGF